MEVILWEADAEFPAQVSFTVPAHLDRFWQLDAVLGLLGLVVKEILRAGRKMRSLIFSFPSCTWERGTKIRSRSRLNQPFA